MGVIFRQAIKSTVYSYIGAALGFLTVWYMNRLWLTPEQNGLLNVLISISLISSSVSNLGMGGVTVRMFPHFRDPHSKHRGFLFYPLLFTGLGTLLFILLFLLFRDDYVARNAAQSSLLNEYIHYLIPLTLFLGIFNILDVFSRGIYLSTAGVIVKEVALRIAILIAAIAYRYGYITFDTFVLLYVGSFCSIALAMALILYLNNEWHWRIPKHKLSPSTRREMRDVAVFSVITGLSGMLISSIDKIIVNDMLGLAAAGVFSIATYFGSMIQIPARSIIRISSTVIAESWKNNDLENIATVYRKTCLNQLVIGLFLLSALAVNIDSLLKLMPADYAIAKNVILLMGLGYLVDLATGANGVIISTSVYYRYDTFFMVLLVVFTIATNLLLIPTYGLTGAGIASCLTYTLFNLLRLVFIYRKFGMQPYSIVFMKVLLAGLCAVAAAWIIPDITNPYLDIAAKGLTLSIIYGALVIGMQISEEINTIGTKIKKLIFP